MHGIVDLLDLPLTSNVERFSLHPAKLQHAQRLGACNLSAGTVLLALGEFY
jgi:hypothetical protein